MNQKKFTIILSIIALIIAILALFIAWQNRLPRITELPSSATEYVPTATTTILTSNISEWKTYKNTKYGYEFQYPAEGLLQKTVEMERGTVNESTDINLGIPGGRELLQVSTGIFYAFDVVNGAIDNGLVGLKSFVKNIREIQVKSINPNFKNKLIGNIAELVFVGKDAYEFTLDSYFAYPSGQYGIVGTHNYIITEHNGTRFIIHYPIDSKLAQEVIDSFKFINE